MDIFTFYTVISLGITPYHSIKGREEDDVHKSKTSQNRMYSRTNHAANPTVSDRQEQVAITQHEKSSTPATGKKVH